VHVHHSLPPLSLRILVSWRLKIFDIFIRDPVLKFFPLVHHCGMPGRNLYPHSILEYLVVPFDEEGLE
jgi:hypothetical protein